MVNVVLNGDVQGSATEDAAGNVNVQTSLTTSGVAASTYGSSTNVPQITVDSAGRITAVVNKAISQVPGPQGPAGPTGATGPRGLTGLTGLTGPQGPAGPTGPAGPIGPQGTRGPTGLTGPEGPIGKGINLRGSISTVSQLPATGNLVGDVFTVIGSSVAKVWSGGAWRDVHSLQGPKGDRGDTGEQGPQGPVGLTGPQGPQGPASSGSGEEMTPDSTDFEYNQNELVTTSIEHFASHVRVTSYEYDADGTVQKITTNVNGIITTQSFTFDANGLVSSIINS